MSSELSYGDPDTRKRILEVTREVVAAKGTAMSVKDVAERADVSRQAVYLHFGDRTGLVLALVRHMDEVLALGDIVAAIMSEKTGAEVIAATMRAHVPFNQAIDSVALILESAQNSDEALTVAWRDRMQFRRAAHRAFVERIAELGELDDAWSVDEAADLFYSTTMIGPWRELTTELGWTQGEYVERLSKFLERALLR
ncbi:MAG: TetR/AcrR family transcriptional regulator [Acidimicrobiia bacterium]|nr:TetR/AcrR family transcriptional regulator [Acidimicrobiia bacterium]